VTAAGPPHWTSRNGRDLGGEGVTLRGRRVTLPELPQTGRRGVLATFAEAVATGANRSARGSVTWGAWR
jgi:hypothetical protein